MEGKNQNNYLNKFNQYDIVFAQETKFNSILRKENLINKWNKIFKSKVFINDNNQNKNAGVAIFIKANSKIKDIEILENINIQQRYLVLKTNINNKIVYLHNIYAPVQYKERIQFFGKLPTNFPNESEHIVSGDFNTVLNKNLDSYSNTHQNYYGSTQLQKWLNKLNLIDTWRHFNPIQKGTTGPKRRNRIDYIFLTNYFIQNTKNIKLKTGIGHSDHLAIETQIQSSNIKIGKGYWKCPVWLTQDTKVQESLQDILQTWINKYINDTNNLEKNYRLLKQQIRKTLQTFQKNKINMEKNKTKQYFENLETAFYKFNQNPTESNKENIKNARKQLKEFREQISTTNQQKTFSDLYLKQEKNTKRFIKKIKYNHTNSHTITSVQTDEQISKDQNDIVKYHRKYWEDIFKSKKKDKNYETEINNFLNKIKTKLSEQEKKELDQEITNEEIEQAIEKK